MTIIQDNSGFITAEKLKFIFGNGNLMPEDTWKQLVAGDDLNGDNKISLSEFKTMMTRIVSKHSV
jgi:Ca2+-binding EF-hand superfamily protein